MPIEQVDVIRTQTVVEGLPQYQADLERAAGALDKVAVSEKDAGMAAASLATEMDSSEASVARKTKAIDALATGLRAFMALGVGALMKKQAEGFLEAAANIEAYEKRFVRFLGSAQAARERIAELRGLARELPGVNLEQLEQASRMMEYFELSTGRGVDELKLFGDVALATKAPLETIIMTAARLKEGIYMARTGFAAGLTPSMLKEQGIRFEGRQVVEEDRARLLAAGLAAWAQKFGGLHKEMAKTAIDAIEDMGEAWKELQAGIGRGILPMVTRLARAGESLADMMKKADPGVLRSVATFTLLGAATAGAAAVYQGYLTLKRIGLIAESTDAIAKGRAAAATNLAAGAEAKLTASIVEKDVAMARSLGVSETAIAQMYQQAAAANALAAANERVALTATGAAARGGLMAAGGIAAAARGFAGRMGGFLGRFGPMAAGTYLGLDILRGLTRPREPWEGAQPEAPRNPLWAIGAGGWAGSRFGPIGAGVGAIAGGAWSLWDIRNISRYNEEIERRNEQSAKREITRLKGMAEEKKRLKEEEEREAKEEQRIADLRKASEAQKEQLAVMEAQARIAAARNEKERENIPWIQKQVEGAKQYAALLDDLIVKLGKEGKEGEERKKAEKERLDTLVSVAEMERRIRDIAKEARQERAKEFEFLIGLERERAEKARELRERDKAAAGEYWKAMEENASAAQRLLESRGQLTPALAAAFGGERGIARQQQLAGIGQEEFVLRWALERGALLKGMTTGEMQARLMALQGQRLAIQQRAYADIRAPQDLQAQQVRNLLEAMEGQKKLALEYGYAGDSLRRLTEEIQAARNWLIRFYSTDLQQYLPGTQEWASRMKAIQGLQADQLADTFKPMKDAFDESLARQREFPAKLVSELQQQAINAPAGLSLLLPSPAELDRTRGARILGQIRPRDMQTVIQINIAGGDREAILARIRSELTRYLDTEFIYEADAYSLRG